MAIITPQIGFHDQKNVRKLTVIKKNEIVNRLNKTKSDDEKPDFAKERQVRTPSEKNNYEKSPRSALILDLFECCEGGGWMSLGRDRIQNSNNSRSQTRIINSPPFTLSRTPPPRPHRAPPQQYDLELKAERRQAMTAAQKEERRMREEKREKEELRSYKTLFSPATMAEAQEELHAKKDFHEFEDDFM